MEADSSSNVVKYQLTSLFAKVPRKASDGAAGYDLFAPYRETIAPRTHKCVSLGLKLELPVGTYGRIAPRSGFAANFGVDIGGGVIDADFRGEVRVLVFNHGENPICFDQGTSIAQLIVEEIRSVEFKEVGELTFTKRGVGGFGSTDIVKRF